MKLPLAMVGCACVAIVVHDTPKLIAAVVPVPGSHMDTELPNNEGCTAESRPDGPTNVGSILPARLNAYRSIFPTAGAAGVAEADNIKFSLTVSMNTFFAPSNNDALLY